MIIVNTLKKIYYKIYKIFILKMIICINVINIILFKNFVETLIVLLNILLF